MLVRTESLTGNQFKIRKGLVHVFGKESLKIAKMLKQSGNRLEAGMGMKMQKTFPFQTLLFHCSFTVIKNHHGLEFSVLENVYLLSVSFCLCSIICSLSGMFMNKRGWVYGYSTVRQNAHHKHKSTSLYNSVSICHNQEKVMMLFASFKQSYNLLKKLIRTCAYKA